MEIQVKRGMRHRGQRVLNNDFGRGDVVLVGVWYDLRLSKLVLKVKMMRGLRAEKAGDKAIYPGNI